MPFDFYRLFLIRLLMHCGPQVGSSVVDKEKSKEVAVSWRRFSIAIFVDPQPSVKIMLD